MIYGAINEKGEDYYTEMSRVFCAIRNRQMDYNWLITDMDCVPQQICDRCKGENYCWLTGDELSRIVNADNRQWAWAVLSGFEKSIPLSEILRYPHPYADGYKGFWVNPVSIQHPLAIIEIVAWDSGATLLFSRKKEMVQDFLHFFPLSEDISVYNAR